MEKSQSIGSLAKALATFHIKVGKIAKDANNPFFKSKYASLSNILDAITIPLSEAGLSFAQFPTDDHGLTTILMHGESGEFIQSNYSMRPVKDDPQGRGSAITYQRRYALAAVLGLNIDEDDDANAATGHKNGSSAQNNGNGGPEKDWLNKGTELYNAAVKKLKEGTTTIERIKSAYRLSREMETELKSLAKSN